MKTKKKGQKVLNRKIVKKLLLEIIIYYYLILEIESYRSYTLSLSNMKLKDKF